MDDLSSERDEYSAVASSKTFSSQTNSTRFLKYVCEKRFAGAEHISESEIAVEVLGRRADFDPQHDSIVRVEAHRLRKRLQDYYQREGSGNSQRLVLPHGSYMPQFLAAPAEQRESEEQANRAAASTVQRPPIPTLQHRNRFAVFSAFLALLCAAVFATGMLVFFHKSSGQKSDQAAYRTTSPIPPSTPSSGLLIMAGSSASSYTDQLGHVWSADRDFHGGQSWTARYRRIWRTDDPQLFLTARQGEDFEYDIPLKRGNYELRLYFAETYYGVDNSEGGGESSRMFDVMANGNPILTDFDPLSDAGGSNTADVRVFTGISPAADGKLHLRFRNHWQLKGVAFVNAIQIIPIDGTAMLPVRWVASTSALVDQKGQLWVPDQFVAGGRRRELAEATGNTKDSELYQSERYGNFSYAIPVAPNNTYTLTLYFAEHWFGLPNDGPPGPAVGMRLFDVYCNGIYLLRDFDIYKEAGGSLRAVTETFHGLKPNHQGKIFLSFVPDRNYASVTALQLTPEYPTQ